MSKLSTKQLRTAVIIGLLLYVAAIAGVSAWLFFNSEETIQRRVAMTPSVTVSLPGKQTSVPSSWTESKTEEAPKEEPAVAATPEAMPPQTEIPQEIAKTEAPKVEEKITETPPVVEEAKPVEVIPVVETPAVETQPVEAAVGPEQQAQPALPLLRWQKYARPFDQADTRPRIALVIADLGLASSATQVAIQELPGEISLAFSSLTTDLEGWVAKARAAGHETIVTVPMEPENYPQNDPGPNTLLTGLSDKDNVERIRWALARADGYVAVMPYMGEKFVTSDKKLAPVLDVVGSQGLLMFDSTQNKNSLIAPMSRLGKIPFVRADLLVDAAASRTAIDVQLENLEKLAKERGQAVGIALPYPVTFEKLKTWIATLEAKGIVLAPLTALASEEVPTAAQPVIEALKTSPQADPAEMSSTKPATDPVVDENRPANELVQ